MAFNLKDLQKRGQAGMNSKMTALVGGLIIVVLAVSLAPTMFSSLADLDADVNTPDWVAPVLFVIVGAGIVFLIWRAFNR